VFIHLRRYLKITSNCEKVMTKLCKGLVETSYRVSNRTMHFRVKQIKEINAHDHTITSVTNVILCLLYKIIRENDYLAVYIYLCFVDKYNSSFTIKVSLNSLCHRHFSVYKCHMILKRKGHRHKPRRSHVFLHWITVAWILHAQNWGGIVSVKFYLPISVQYDTSVQYDRYSLSNTIYKILTLWYTLLSQRNTKKSPSLG
jgi:hypothetical protein